VGHGYCWVTELTQSGRVLLFGGRCTAARRRTPLPARAAGHAAEDLRHRASVRHFLDQGLGGAGGGGEGPIDDEAVRTRTRKLRTKGVWEMWEDRQDGEPTRVFYCNVRTQQLTWEQPICFQHKPKPPPKRPTVPAAVQQPPPPPPLQPVAGAASSVTSAAVGRGPHNPARRTAGAPVSSRVRVGDEVEIFSRRVNVWVPARVHALLPAGPRGDEQLAECFYWVKDREYKKHVRVANVRKPLAATSVERAKTVSGHRTSSPAQMPAQKQPMSVTEVPKLSAQRSHHQQQRQQQEVQQPYNSIKQHMEQRKHTEHRTVAAQLNSDLVIPPPLPQQLPQQQQPPAPLSPQHQHQLSTGLVQQGDPAASAIDTAGSSNGGTAMLSGTRTHRTAKSSEDMDSFSVRIQCLEKWYQKLDAQPSQKTITSLMGQLQQLDVEMNQTSVRGLSGQDSLLPRRKALLARIEKLTQQVEQAAAASATVMQQPEPEYEAPAFYQLADPVRTETSRPSTESRISGSEPEPEPEPEPEREPEPEPEPEREFERQQIVPHKPKALQRMPSVTPVLFFLATRHRISGQVEVAELGECSLAEAVCEWDKCDNFNGHALFKVDGQSIELVRRTWVLVYMDTLQEAVMHAASASLSCYAPRCKEGWLQVHSEGVGQGSRPGLVSRRYIKLDRHFVLHFSKYGPEGSAEEVARDREAVHAALSRNVSTAVKMTRTQASPVKAEIDRISCEDIDSLRLDGQTVTVIVKDRAYGSTWQMKLLAESISDAWGWFKAIEQAHSRATSLTTRFHRQRVEYTTLRHSLVMRLHKQRQLLARNGCATPGYRLPFTATESTVTFASEGALGLHFAWPAWTIGSIDDGGLCGKFPLGEVPPYGNLAVAKGMVAVAIGDTSVAGLSSREGTEILRKAGRPVTLTFRATSLTRLIVDTANLAIVTERKENRVIPWLPVEQADRCCASTCEVYFAKRRLGAPVLRDTCRLCGLTMCPDHMTAVDLPGATGETELRVELNSAVDVWSDAICSWEPARVTAMDDARGEVTVTYMAAAAAAGSSEAREKVVKMNLVGNTAECEVRPRGESLSTGIQLPVCTTCQHSLRTVSDLDRAEVASGNRISQELHLMTRDFDRVNILRKSGELTKSVIRELKNTWIAAAAAAAASRPLASSAQVHQIKERFKSWIDAQQPCEITASSAGAVARGAAICSTSSFPDVGRTARGIAETVLRQGGQCMKALLLDHATVAIVNATMSDSDLSSTGVFFKQLVPEIVLAKDQQRLGMAAIVWIAPLETNVQILEEELSAPRFSEYHVTFTDRAGADWDDFLGRLARADVFELVASVSKQHCEYIAVDSHLFVLDLCAQHRSSAPCIQNEDFDTEAKAKRQRYETALPLRAQGLMGAMKSFGITPAEIRFSSHSKSALGLATAVASGSVRDSWRVGGGSNPVLLIIDRSDDPFTPLLFQWRFLSMIYELLDQDVNINTVDILTNDGLMEVPLRPASTDELEKSFFARNAHSFWPLALEHIDLVRKEWARVKDEIADLNKHGRKAVGNKVAGGVSQQRQAVELLEQRRESMLEVQQQVSLFMKLAKLVDDSCCLKVSQFQQGLLASLEITDGDFEADLARLRQLLDELLHISQDSEQPVAEATKQKLLLQRQRTLLLFVLRYCMHGETGKLQQVLDAIPRTAELLTDARERALLEAACRLFTRAPGWTDVRRGVAEAGQHWRSSLPGDCEQVLQARPRLEHTLRQLMGGRLDPERYPRRELSVPTPEHTSMDRGLGRDVLVFMVGGVTLEEARIVRSLNEESRQSGSGWQIALGGDFVTTCRSFIDAMPTKVARPAASSRTSGF
jgi:vacuolar protein sorting-associated protein 45